MIASMNGTTEAGWVDYAQLIEQAGAAALELNVYRIASGPSVTGASAEAGLRGAGQSRPRSGGDSRGGQIASLLLRLWRVGPAA